MKCIDSILDLSVWKTVYKTVRDNILELLCKQLCFTYISDKVYIVASKP